MREYEGPRVGYQSRSHPEKIRNILRPNAYALARFHGPEVSLIDRTAFTPSSDAIFAKTSDQRRNYAFCHSKPPDGVVPHQEVYS